jgi:predicted nucleotidyltransferase
VVEISCKALFAIVFLAIVEQRFELTKDEIEKVKQKLAVALKRYKEISFAYLHGSFGTLPFRDIDIGAYCFIPEERVFDFELEMSAGLGTVSEYPVDFKVLNFAPIGFQFSVINEGTLLFEKDGTNRLNFVEDVGLKYMDYFEFSKSYLRELMECIKK